MILGLELAFLITGLIALCTGKLTLGAKMKYEGPAVRLAGMFFILPLPLCFFIGVAMGVANPEAFSPSKMPEIRLQLGLIEFAVVILCGLVGLGVSLLGGSAQDEFFQPTGKPRRRQPDLDEVDALDESVRAFLKTCPAPGPNRPEPQEPCEAISEKPFPSSPPVLEPVPEEKPRRRRREREPEERAPRKSKSWVLPVVGLVLALLFVGAACVWYGAKWFERRLAQQPAPAAKEDEQEEERERQRRRVTDEMLRAEADAVRALEAEALRIAAEKAKAAPPAEKPRPGNLSYAQLLALSQQEASAGKANEALRTLDRCPAEQRGWEWNCLHRLYQDSSCVKQFEAPMPERWPAVFSTTSRYLAYTTGPAVKVYDRSTGKSRACEIPAALRSHDPIAVSPNGDRVLVMPFTKKATLLDVETGTKVWEVKDKGAWYTSALFSADGLRLAMITMHDTKIHDAGSGHLLFSIPCKQFVTFTADSTQVLGMVNENDARLAGGAVFKVWDVNRGLELRSVKLPIKGQHVRFADLSPDRSRLALLDSEQQLTTWDVATGKELSRSERLKQSPRWMGYGRDGRLLFVHEEWRKVRVVEAVSGQTLWTLSEPVEGFYHVEGCPRGGVLLVRAHVAGSHMLQLWNLENRSPLSALVPAKKEIKQLAFQPQGKSLAGVNSEGGVSLWRLDQPSKPSQPCTALKAPVRQVNFSRDGRYLAAATSKGLEVLEVTESGVSATAASFPGDFVFAAFDTEGRLHAAQTNGHVGLFDVAARREVRSFTLEGGQPGQCVLSDDGKWLACAVGSEARLTDLSQPSSTAGVVKKLAGLQLLGLSPNGATLAATCQEADKTTLVVFDLVQNREIIRQNLGRTPVHALTFTTDGKRVLLSAERGEIRAVQVDTGQVVATLPVSTPPLTRLSLGPTGTLAAADREGKVFLWETSSR